MARRGMSGPLLGLPEVLPWMSGPLLLGQDPLNHQRHVARFVVRSGGFERAVGLRAVAAIWRAGEDPTRVEEASWVVGGGAP